MIICSCNVLSEAQVLETLKLGHDSRPKSAAQTYRCLGCAPRCGRCLATVHALVAKAHLDNCQVGCSQCPGHDAHDHSHDAAPAYEAAPARKPALMPAE